MPAEKIFRWRPVAPAINPAAGIILQIIILLMIF